MQGKKILFTIHNLSAGCNSFHKCDLSIFKGPLATSSTEKWYV